MAVDPYAYPVGGFSFELTVFANLVPIGELRCQSVTGLEQSMGWSDMKSPVTSMTPLPPLANGLTYKDLVVTKGVVASGGTFDTLLLQYMRLQSTNLGTPFLSLTLMLLSETGFPVRAWCFTSVVISSWKVSGIDAQKSGYAVDEIVFKFKECYAI